MCVGSGPSYLRFPREKLNNYRVYGCGSVTNNIDVDVYCIGDNGHLTNLPKDKKTSVFYTDGTELEITKNTLNFSRLGVGHGCSSGGMCISVACLFHDYIELVGFDCPLGINLNRDWPLQLRELLIHWMSKGKKFYCHEEHSSIFTNLGLLAHPEQFT